MNKEDELEYQEKRLLDILLHQTAEKAGVKETSLWEIQARSYVSEYEDASTQAEKDSWIEAIMTDYAYVEAIVKMLIEQWNQDD